MFRIYVDGVKKYDSGAVLANRRIDDVQVDVTNGRELKIEVNQDGGGNYFDHADWGGARLLTPTSTFVSDLTPTGTPVNGWGPYEKDKSNGETAAGDGGTLTIEGKTYAKGLGVHANSELHYSLAGANYKKFISDIGLDDETGRDGSVVFRVYVDGVQKYDSGVVDANRRIDDFTVDVTGGRELVLIVNQDGGGNFFDHADWGGARLTS